MAKHVYPPWHSNIQKFLFAVAVILCITLPVLYGEHDSDISSTTVIIVLVLYFCLWIAFSLGVRLGIASYTVESTLPVHTPSPAPPVFLHEPAGRNAVPFSPALKISSPSSGGEGKPSKGARFVDDSDEDFEGEGQVKSENARGQLKQQERGYLQPHGGLPMSPVTPPSPSSPNGASNAVHFQTRQRALTGDSTQSTENYPTYAVYRQQQHASFDAFAQRIRRALETANAQQRRELMERQQQQQQKQQQLEQQEKEDPRNDKDRRISNIERASGSHLKVHGGEGTSKGRPRSSSTASVISNISGKLRLVGSNTSAFFGRSRAGSDASLAPPAAATLTVVTTPHSLTESSIAGDVQDNRKVDKESVQNMDWASPEEQILQPDSVDQLLSSKPTVASENMGSISILPSQPTPQGEETTLDKTSLRID